MAKKFRPGVTFSDFIVQESKTAKLGLPNNMGLGLRLSSWMMLVVAGCLIILLTRLVSLQLLQGGKNLVLANENRIRKIVLPAPRGKILDRNGIILADNDKDGRRIYPLGQYSSHVLGYLGEVGESEVGLLTPKGDKYRNQGLIGRMGLESQYEDSLRGVDGGRLVEVDTSEKIVRELGEKKPQAGTDLQTTLDASLQKTAGEALTKKGGVIVSNPKTGEILALVSSPSFNPETLNTQYSMLNAQKDLPFFNRAIGGVYPPGSTFKMITTIAALSEKKVPENFTYIDTGSINIGKFSYTNWFFSQYGRTEGEVGWVRALTRSTDTFFYKVGEMTGPDILAMWASKMGLGAKTGIDIPGEIAGLIPTPGWKQQTKGEAWFLGNTYHMAIGQGDILTTPLQINLMTNILATGGEKCRPHINKMLNTQCSTLNINNDILKIVKEGMVGACEEGGTAFPLFGFTPKVTCKTGTAEYVRSDGRVGSHAWFTIYAPADDPTISVTVLVEGGGEGSTAAAPVARKILAKYFGVEDKFNYAAVQGVGE